MVTFRQLTSVGYLFICTAVVSYYYKYLEENKNPETRKQRYYKVLKGEGFYKPVNPALRHKKLDEEDKEALRKYAP